MDPARVSEWLTKRDSYRPGSLDWQWCNRVAWRLHLLSLGAGVAGHSAPPADFGPQYIEHREAA